MPFAVCRKCGFPSEHPSVGVHRVGGSAVPSPARAGTATFGSVWAVNVCLPLAGHHGAPGQEPGALHPCGHPVSSVPEGPSTGSLHTSSSINLISLGRGPVQCPAWQQHFPSPPAPHFPLHFSSLSLSRRLCWCRWGHGGAEGAAAGLCKPPRMLDKSISEPSFLPFPSGSRSRAANKGQGASDALNRGAGRVGGEQKDAGKGSPSSLPSARTNPKRYRANKIVKFNHPERIWPPLLFQNTGATYSFLPESKQDQMLPRSSPLGSSAAEREIHIRRAPYLRFDRGCSRAGEIKTKQGRRVLPNFLSFSFTPPGPQSLLGADARWRQQGSTGVG